MNKNKSLFKIVILSITIFLLSFLTVSCTVDFQSAGTSVSSISIFSTGKIEYLTGEGFDITNYSIYVQYSNKTNEVIPLTEDMLDKENIDMNLPEEEKEVVISYKGLSAHFFIKVSELEFDRIELITIPHKTTYIEGESIDPSGAKISIIYEGGNKVDIEVTPKMMEDYDNNVGERNIIIPYLGETLTFSVNFIPRTVISFDILREPKQVNVFKNYSDRLSRDNMKIRLHYDNGVEEIFENSITSDSTVAEVVAQNRNKWSTKINDNLKIYIRDDIVDSSANAKVSFIEPGIEDEIVYNFVGSSMVSVGDIVSTNTVMATTNYLEDIKSKSEGIVTKIEIGKITVSRNVVYECNQKILEIGDIVLKEEVLGTQAGVNVVAGVSGMVVAKTSGQITIRALPTSNFPIGVVDRSFESMEIIAEPTTKKDNNSIYNIIQGDSINYSTGIVKVTYDNGETENFAMDDSHISLIKTSTNLRKEIPGFTFTGIVDQKNVVVNGAYELKYGYTLENEDDEQYLTTTVSVVDELGNVYVNGNRYFNPENNKIYTVSVVVTYLNNQTKLVSEDSYTLATGDATPNLSQLDISEAGRHTLHILYDGMESQYASMNIIVVQKVPVSMIIDDYTNNITNHPFYIDDEIPFNSMKYKINYSNGDQDKSWTLVTKDMVIAYSDFVEKDENANVYLCSDVGVHQFITIALHENDAITFSLSFDIEPYAISNIIIKEAPIDEFLSLAGDTSGVIGSSLIDLSGAEFSITYVNGKSMILDDSGYEGFTLNQLLTNGKNGVLPNLQIEFNAEDTEVLTLEQVYDIPTPYKAKVTFVDKYNQSFTITNSDNLLNYYIVDKKPDSIKITKRANVDGYNSDSYKINYIQCEDWDFTNLELFVTYPNGDSTISESIPMRKEMVYKSNTNKTGNNYILYVRYLGIMEENPNFTYNVSERVETGVSMLERGKADYLITENELDLSEYKFRISYNAGTSTEVNGITSFVGNAQTKGWWYDIYDAEIKVGDLVPSPSYDINGNMILSNMRTVGDKIVRLHHTNILEAVDSSGNCLYSDSYFDFYINITYTGNGVSYIAFEDTTIYKNGVPVLGSFTIGMPLIYTYFANDCLMTKVLTIHYSDGLEAFVKLTDENISVDFDTDNLSIGYRTINISYLGKACVINANIRDAELDEISLTNDPTKYYISGDSISIDGGILKAKYTYKDDNNNDVTFENYVLLNENTPFLTYDQIDSNIDLEDDEGNYIERVTKTINITYGMANNSKPTQYEVYIYNKRDIEYVYGNVIFFYGNTKGAMATPVKEIEEFDLPNAVVPKYVSNEFFITKDNYDLLSSEEKENCIEILVKENFNSDITMIMYVRKDNILQSRPYTPARGGYDYYILMEVAGNHYYKECNYCYHKYVIVPKVIGVNLLNSNENAFVLRFSTDNNPIAVDYVYNNIANINGFYASTYDFITSVIFASPNVNYFEIIINLNTNYSEIDDRDDIVDIYSQIQALIQPQSNILSSSITKGVNIAQYNGGQPEFISYTIEQGETLKLGGVLELLNGKLEIDTDKFGVGQYTYQNDNNTLYHNNYTLDLVGKDLNFEVTSCEVDENDIVVNGLVGGILTINTGDNVQVQVVPSDSNMSARFLNDYEILYYTNVSRTPDSIVDGMPTEAGTYYAQLDIGYYIYSQASINQGQPYELQFTLVIL